MTDIREPLPDTMFGDNFLEAEFIPTGTTLRFECADALAHWGDADRAIAERLIADNEFKGTAGSRDEGELGKVMPSEVALPVERYLVHDEVLFYDDVVLYQDGHGDSHVKLQIKIRVMHDRFLILLRLFQSKPGLGVRLVDTRYAHEFGEHVVISDTEVRCESAEELGGKSQGGALEADVVYDLVEPCYRVDEKVLVSADT